MSVQSTNSISEAVMPSLQGVVPSVISTCSLDGIPNTTYISQVYYVDETHVAISQQFFNKTIKNVEENPFLCVIATCPVKYVMWKMMLQFIESQTTGEIFENMSTQLEIIASMQRHEGLFTLRSADIYEVVSIELLE